MPAASGGGGNALGNEERELYAVSEMRLRKFKVFEREMTLS